MHPLCSTRTPNYRSGSVPKLTYGDTDLPPLFSYVLVPTWSTVGLALTVRGHALGAAPATAVRLQGIRVLHRRSTPPAVAPAGSPALAWVGLAAG